ncbi:AAA family ATPase [Vibrio echinoideorum]|uniref:AAA family ATPase n=1 Tax=Vibrio echinoideorum TaxID=2100116 RepID=A0ABU9FSB9_9VIBR
MHIEYIYINLYKGIEELSFPFTSESNIEFDIESKQFSLPKPNSEKSPRYYNGINCSAIVGRNGVGKSTILDFIKNQTIYGNLYGVIVFRDGNHRYIYDPLSLCEVVGKTQYFTHVQSKNRDSSFNGIRLVNLTNIHELDSALNSSKKSKSKILFDFSPRIKLSKEVKKENFRRINSYLSHEGNDVGHYSGYAFTPNKKSIKSILNQYKLLKPTDLKNLSKPLSSEIGEALTELKSGGVEYYSNEYDILVNRVTKDLHSTYETTLLLNITPNIIKSVIKLHFKKDNVVSILFFVKYIRKITKEYNTKYLNTHDILTIIEECLYHYCNNEIIEPSIEIVNTFNYIVEILFELYKNIEIYQATVGEDGTIITNDFDAAQSITETINKFPTLISDSFDIGWVGISSGEFAKIRIFSELYHYITSELDTSPDNTEPLSSIIFVDEADLYLHPEWQRTFLHDLVKMINGSSSKNKFQVIVTSHSPIIISDFLPNDIVSLRKDNQVVKVQPALGFGTNITELFIDGMHINSTFGELSRYTIENILERYNNNSLTEYDKFLISQIGNENIKKQLSV